MDWTIQRGETGAAALYPFTPKEKRRRKWKDTNDKNWKFGWQQHRLFLIRRVLLCWWVFLPWRNQQMNEKNRLYGTAVFAHLRGHWPTLWPDILIEKDVNSTENTVDLMAIGKMTSYSSSSSSYVGSIMMAQHVPCPPSSNDWWFTHEPFINDVFLFPQHPYIYKCRPPSVAIVPENRPRLING